jgi:outer membrane scaffolding protein for murein synthesis (MipA/OmpV family)
MGDIRARPEVGVFADYRLVPGLIATSSVRFGSGNDRDGALMEMGLRGMLPLSSSIRLTAGIGTTWANRAAMQSQFGVSASQAQPSGYAVYSPDGGLRDVELQVGTMWLLSQNLSLRLGIQARSLMSNAKDSPLTRDRSGLSAVTALSFRL